MAADGDDGRTLDHVTTTPLFTNTHNFSDHNYVIAGTAGSQQRYGNSASHVIGLFWCGLLYNI
ncbi:hypothetical protein J6590_091374 [Homalodisca vitripennis]|nr:hypothetical protein J6590_091374 [Homalodisca vitripennis]